MRLAARIAFLLSLCLAVSLAAETRAVPIVGGETAVELTGAAGLGPAVDLGLLGSASVDALGRVVFPVTGGTLGSTLEHDGSGISLTTRTGTPSGPVFRSIHAENFLIDLGSFSLLADVSFFVDGVLDSQVDDLLLFDLRECLPSAASDPCLAADGSSVILAGLGLRLAEGLETTIAGFLFADAHPADIPFVEELLRDLDFGVATSRVETGGEVPEPSVGLLGLGMLGLWVAGRRRAAKPS